MVRTKLSTPGLLPLSLRRQHGQTEGLYPSISEQTSKSSNEGLSTRRQSYDVGYRKPPKSSQFQKGNAGNKKGRKKGTKNFATLVGQELDKKISVNDQRISKRELIATNTVNKAAKGDRGALEFLKPHLEGPAVPGSESSAPQGPHDDEIIAAFIQMVKDAPDGEGIL